MFEEISCQCLTERVLSKGDKLLLLDFRRQNEFDCLHIRGAVLMQFPQIILKRLKRDLIPIASVFKHSQLTRLSEFVAVLYEDDDSHSALIGMVFNKLKEEGCAEVYILRGGFSCFRSEYPELCDGLKQGIPLIGGLQSLRIYETPASLPRSPTTTSVTFPLEIIPHLFLGDAETAKNLELFERRSITHIVNVSIDLPNYFEESTTSSLHYMRVPIDDHWSQNLAAYFFESISFIDRARRQHKGVLVHCLAGLSRSVTIVVAYLMYREQLCLNDAFDRVRECNPKISPNFNFLGQLLDFERRLKTKTRNSVGLSSVSSASSVSEPEPDDMFYFTSAESLSFDRECEVQWE